MIRVQFNEERYRRRRRRLYWKRKAKDGIHETNHDRHRKEQLQRTKGIKYQVTIGKQGELQQTNQTIEGAKKNIIIYCHCDIKHAKYSMTNSFAKT